MSYTPTKESLASVNYGGKKVDVAEVRAKQFPVLPKVPTGEDPPPLPDSFPTFVRPPGLPYTCTDEMLLEAVKCYLIGTDEKTLARMLCVDTKSVRYWTDSREWAALIELQTPELKMMLKGQLTRVASMTLRQLEDRLTYGDQVFDMTGKFVRRREIKGRDLSEIMTRVLEQRANLEKVIGNMTDPDGKLDLQEIADGLAQYAKQKRFDASKEIEGDATTEPN